MVANLDNDVKVRSLQVGDLAAPPDISAGAAVMSTTNRPQGSMHLRTAADCPPEVRHNDAVRKLGFADRSLECRLANLTPGGVRTYVTYMPTGGIVTGVRRRYTTAPASGGGTVVAGITVAGNQILASASESEEGLANDTLAAHALTGTSANLKATKGDKVVITVTSNNGDMTGGTDPIYFIDFDHN